MAAVRDADHVVDFTRQDVTRRGVRFDVVFYVVSQAPFSMVRRVLEPDGTYVLVGHGQYRRSGHRVLGSIGWMLSLLAISPFVHQIPGIRPGPSRGENWATIVELLEAGRVNPVDEDPTFARSMARPPAPLRAGGRATGTVLVRPAYRRPCPS